MMSMTFGTSASEAMQFYADGVGPLLGDITRQVTSSNSYRNARPNAAGPMRVVKPKSASNSPRDALGLARRRSVMSDDSARRRAAMAEHQMLAGAGMLQNPQYLAKSNRPMSWHPSSTHPAPQSYLQPSTYHSRAIQYNMYSTADTSPSATAYSAYTSPVSAISPLSLPYTEYDFPQDAPLFPPYSGTNYNSNQHNPSRPTQASTLYGNVSLATHFDWNHFVAHSVDATGPPTPDNSAAVQNPLPTFATDEAMPYHSLTEEEDTGEELIGMGLYDDVAKPPLSHSHLNPYQTMMTPQLLGSFYSAPESRGKGLKLEETWVPPADDEDGDDQDGDGEETIESIGR